MLKIISPRDHESQRQRIDAFLDLLAVYQEFDLPSEKQSKSHFKGVKNQNFGQMWLF